MNVGNPVGMDHPVLEVRDLSVLYGAEGIWARNQRLIQAVDGVSLTVQRGEIVGVVGESGSGKSTLGLALAGLVPISGGTFNVDGIERRGSVRRRALPPDIQMIFQNPHASLDPRQSVKAGIRELRTLHPQRSRWIDDRELLSSVGLSTNILDRYPHQLSGGQCQRIAIARALLLQPSLIIADEPTSSLDVSVQAQVLSLFLQLREARRLSIVFISHDLSVVHFLCDRVYVMRGGRFLESGPTGKVFGSPADPYTQRLVDCLPGKEFAASIARNSGTAFQLMQSMDLVTITSNARYESNPIPNIGIQR